MGRCRSEGGFRVGPPNGSATRPPSGRRGLSEIKIRTIIFKYILPIFLSSWSSSLRDDFFNYSYYNIYYALHSQLTLDPGPSCIQSNAVVSNLYIVGINCMKQRCRRALPKFYKFPLFTNFYENSTNLINEHCKNILLLSEKHNYVETMSVFGDLDIFKRLGAMLPCVL